MDKMDRMVGVWYSDIDNDPPTNPENPENNSICVLTAAKYGDEWRYAMATKWWSSKTHFYDRRDGLAYEVKFWMIPPPPPEEPEQ